MFDSLQRVLALAAGTLALAARAAGVPLDVANVFPQRELVSVPVPVTGYGPTVAVSITGGSYSIGCTGAYVTTAGTANDGDAICLRQTASLAPSTITDTTLTLGTATIRFRSTTAASPDAALISSYYRTILGREADAPGQAYWESQSGVLRSLGADVNEAWRAMATQFFRSPEYLALGTSDATFVANLYETFFNRAPDAPGSAFWQSQLASGLTRDVVLLSFLFSDEFSEFTSDLFGVVPTRPEVNMVVDFYRGYLNRLPDEAGLRYWRARFQAAQCTSPAAVAAEADALSATFAASGEYLARARDNAGYVSDIYNAFLRRGGDPAGFAFWTQSLTQASATRESLRATFRDSPEFVARVAAVAAMGCVNAAGQSDLALSAVVPGASPFLATVTLSGVNLQRITEVTFTVTPKADAMSRPVKVSFTPAGLLARGYGLSGGTFRIPVFGLYGGHMNLLVVDATFDDNSVKTIAGNVSTAVFTDAFYTQAAISVPRTQSNAGFDYFYVKSTIRPPVVMDTDGFVRWTVPAAVAPLFGNSTLFDGERFVTGSRNTKDMANLELDGKYTPFVINKADYTNFHHTIERGKVGKLVQMDGVTSGQPDIENIIAEIDPAGNILKEWRLADIFRNYMISQGDDPSNFVRLGVDWLHTNAVVYDSRDDTLIVSGRETFLVKIDYNTGEIKWILGDPTKHWFTYPSLQAKALTLVGGGLYPIGQHAVSITAEGLVMVFNNGRNSQWNPPNTSAGENRLYSAVSGYAIDPVARTARELLHFDYNQSERSEFCASAYQAGDWILVGYAQAQAATKVRFVALDKNLQVAMDFTIPNSTGCNVGWNSEPIAFDRLTPY